MISGKIHVVLPYATVKTCKETMQETATATDAKHSTPNTKKHKLLHNVTVNNQVNR